MGDHWICTMHSAQEQDEILAALKQAGIPADHVTVSRPPGHGPGPGAEEGRAESGFWPLTDAALSGCAGGAFGAYVGACSMLIPGIRPHLALGPSSIILGSAAVCAVAGMIVSLAIKACFPNHEQELQAEAEKGEPVTMTILGSDRRESQRIHDVLMATGHGDSVFAQG